LQRFRAPLQASPYTEEEAEEEAEAALRPSTANLRTIDPVRMYMREMGIGRTLTREGEIEIAKRIEGGLMRMMEATPKVSATIAEHAAGRGENPGRQNRYFHGGRMVSPTKPTRLRSYRGEDPRTNDEDDDDGRHGPKHYQEARYCAKRSPGFGEGGRIC
jgi:RNA polymerase primary sigma factor